MYSTPNFRSGLSSAFSSIIFDNFNLHRDYSYIICSTERQALYANSRLLFHKYINGPHNNPTPYRKQDTTTTQETAAEDPIQPQLHPPNLSETWVYPSIIADNSTIAS